MLLGSAKTKYPKQGPEDRAPPEQARSFAKLSYFVGELLD
jgi:hypothetical protein